MTTDTTETQTMERRRATFDISPTLIEEVFCLPAGVRIVDASFVRRESTGSEELRFELESTDGRFAGHVQPTYRRAETGHVELVDVQSAEEHAAATLSAVPRHLVERFADAVVALVADHPFPTGDVTDAFFEAERELYSALGREWVACGGCGDGKLLKPDEECDDCSRVGGEG